ncbi:UV DNA damage repair endonuclease UvsE [Paenibacillus sp.]|uniref:UV DNA damage repair endonuclease UvsE n=1 Tax=Paenibacillus sp. TaxID=58172 RepID=UPI002D51E715|nr:UV DNA damage repair endonuclease UvsE [Paenibacillus sp.]HZG83463.1 UV DNA damage repair endonuclease UvsE [Paenibacillus sp.]
MIVRFGYVAMSVHIKNASPSKTMTATLFQTIPDREAAVRKLERIAAENLHNTLRLLKHNRAEGIKLYRLSSKLIPLLTHEMLEGWDPLDALEEDFRRLGDYAKTNGMRLSFHPDHFTVLSTPRKDVLQKSEKDLDWHVSMLERMGLDERYKCNIHIGGTYGNKEKAYERFLRQFAAMPDRLRHRITLENDDKTFTAKETLAACQAVGVPMVLDVHHHAVNNEGERIVELWEDIQRTWLTEKARAEAALRTAGGAADRSEGAALVPEREPVGAYAAAASSGGDAHAAAIAAPAFAAEAAGEPTLTDELLAPKIHVSSPKSDKDPRGHADYVDADGFFAFLRDIAPMTPRLDVMIEAKMKDDALFRLVEEIAAKPGVRRLGGAIVEL